MECGTNHTGKIGSGRDDGKLLYINASMVLLCIYIEVKNRVQQRKSKKPVYLRPIRLFNRAISHYFKLRGRPLDLHSSSMAEYFPLYRDKYTRPCSRVCSSRSSMALFF